MNLRPGLAYGSLDLSDAYIKAKRAAMLRGAAKWCPGHACFLDNVWRANNIAWIQSGPDMWDKTTVVEGTAQGETSSTPAFSRGLRLALEAVKEQADAEGIWLHTPSLVDDMMLVCEPVDFERALQLVGTHCKRVLGCELNLEKCKVYLPERSAAVPSFPSSKCKVGCQL